MKEISIFSQLEETILPNNSTENTFFHRVIKFLLLFPFFDRTRNQKTPVKCNFRHKTRRKAIISDF